MKKFKNIVDFVRSFENGKIDFQDSKTGDFLIVAEEDGKRFFQSFIKSVKGKKSVQIGISFFDVSEKVYL